MSLANLYLRELAESDLLFLVTCLVDKRKDHLFLTHLLKDKPDLVDIMLDDERLFPIVNDDQAAMAKISPYLFFTILLRQARREFERQLVFMEQAQRTAYPLRGLSETRRIMADPDIGAYLAHLLATFTRVECAASVVRERYPAHQRSLNDLSFDEVLNLAATAELPSRYSFYKRLGDISLFLAGVFPEYLKPETGQATIRIVSRLAGSKPRTLREFEQEGRRYYGLAAGYEEKHGVELHRVLLILGEKFHFVCRPLNYLVENYISSRRTRWFA